MNIILFILFIIFACIEGLREGMFFANKGYNVLTDLKIKGHYVYMTERIIALIFIVYYLFSRYPYWIVVPFTASLMLVFSYFHDGCLYAIWNKIDENVYKDGFTSEPDKQSDAIFNFSYRERLLFFVSGIIFFFISLALIVLFNHINQ